MKIKDITDWSERWSISFSGLGLGNKLDDNPDYQNDQKYSHPDSGPEDISDRLTASQDYSREKQKYEEVPRVFLRHPPLPLVRLPLYSSI